MPEPARESEAPGGGPGAHAGAEMAAAPRRAAAPKRRRRSDRYSAGISAWIASRSTPCDRRYSRAAMYTIAASP
jgi:hypothetical protein